MGVINEEIKLSPSVSSGSIMPVTYLDTPNNSHQNNSLPSGRLFPSGGGKYAAKGKFMYEIFG